MRKYYVGDVIKYEGNSWKVMGATFNGNYRTLVLKHIPKDGEEDLGNKLISADKIDEPSVEAPI